MAEVQEHTDDDTHDNGHVERFPDGGIIPPILHDIDAIKLLRLDVKVKRDGSIIQRPLPHSIQQIDRLVSNGTITPIMSRPRRFHRDDILAMRRRG